jgi:hypothetical protein
LEAQATERPEELMVLFGDHEQDEDEVSPLSSAPPQLFFGLKTASSVSSAFASRIQVGGAPLEVECCECNFQAEEEPWTSLLHLLLAVTMLANDLTPVIPIEEENDSTPLDGLSQLVSWADCMQQQTSKGEHDVPWKKQIPPGGAQKQMIASQTWKLMESWDSRRPVPQISGKTTLQASSYSFRAKRVSWTHSLPLHLLLGEGCGTNIVSVTVLGQLFANGQNTSYK